MIIVDTLHLLIKLEAVECNVYAEIDVKDFSCEYSIYYNLNPELLN